MPPVRLSWYPFTALPPSEEGGDHVTVADVPLAAGVTTKLVGALGVPEVAQPVTMTAYAPMLA